MDPENKIEYLYQAGRSFGKEEATKRWRREHSKIQLVVDTAYNHLNNSIFEAIKLDTIQLDIPSPQSPTFIIDHIHSLEDKLLTEVISKVLGRKATIDDAKDCRRVFKPGLYSKYVVTFQGVELGYISRDINEGRVCLLFTPS